MEVLLATQTPQPMSYAEFLAWADEDTHAEWVDGEVAFMSPATDEHQDIGGFLIALMRVFIRHHGLGWVRSAPFQMKTGPDLPGREPDIMYLSNAHLGRRRSTFIDGPADLAVEIISSESITRDQVVKFREYAMGGVSEYWLIDPMNRWAAFFRLEGDQYHTIFAGPEGEFQSLVLPGFWLRVEWLWQEPKPLELDVLRALGVVG
jgi:Uma2 family endonuclease